MYRIAAAALLLIALVPAATRGSPPAPTPEYGTGSISGVVTDVDGHPVAGAHVQASGHTSDTNRSGSAETEADGHYVIEMLPPYDRYTVTFGAPPSANLLDVIYRQQRDYGTATPVEVQDDTTTSGIDAVLPTGGTISGRLTARDTGQPLSGACVQTGTSKGPVFDSTDSTGRYELFGLPTAHYQVLFQPYYHGIGFALFGQKGVCADTELNYFFATRAVAVTEGAAVAGIHQQASPAASIAGRVLDGLGRPEPRVCIRGSGHPVEITDDKGRYRLPLQPAGALRVRFGGFWHVTTVNVGLDSEAYAVDCGYRTYALESVAVRLGRGEALSGVNVTIRFRTRLDVRLRRVGRRRVSVAGRLRVPRRAGGCRPGVVRVAVRTEGEAPVTRRVRLTSRCRWSANVRSMDTRRRLRASATYRGDRVLAPAPTAYAQLSPR